MKLKKMVLLQQSNMVYDYEQEFRSAKSRAPYGRQWYQQWWGMVVIVVFFMCLVASFVYLYVRVTGHESRVTGNVDFEESKSEDFQGSILSSIDVDGRVYRGAENPRVTIFEYIDYECEDCARADDVIDQLLLIPKYRDTVRVVYLHFPIVQQHPNALLSAMASECAHTQGKFDAMHKRLLVEQGNVDAKKIKIMAIQLGLDSVAFGKCFDSNEFLEKINGDTQRALASGLNIAPTVIIGNEKIEGVPSIPRMQQIIDSYFQ